MNEDSIRILIASGFFMLLILLRLEAGRFGAAEYDEPGTPRTGPSTRLSWYLIGFALVGALYVVHPAPHDVLYLLLGHRTDVLVFGGVLAIVGAAQAAAFARFRYGELRFPRPAAYPGAALNSIATAVIDEAAFRGVLLGSLVAIGLPDGLAIVVSTLAYALATRMGSPGRHPYMLLLVLGMGLAFGWATLASGGLGAAIIGHAVTSFSLFLCTGHAGQVPRRGMEPEEVDARLRPPEGWQTAADPIDAGDAEPEAWTIEPSGFSDRAHRRPPAGSGLGGVVDRARALAREGARSALRHPR